MQASEGRPRFTWQDVQDALRVLPCPRRNNHGTCIPACTPEEPCPDCESKVRWLNEEIDDESARRFALRLPEERQECAEKAMELAFHNLKLQWATISEELPYQVKCIGVLPERLHGPAWAKLEHMLARFLKNRMWAREVITALQAGRDPFPAPEQAAAPDETRPVPVGVMDLPESDEAPAELLQGLAWEGQLSILVAREKLGKSTLAAWAVLEAASRGVPTLWVSCDEDPQTIGRRFQAMAEEFVRINGVGWRGPLVRGRPDEEVRRVSSTILLGYIEVLAPRTREDLAQAIESYGEMGPYVLVIDSLSSFLMAVDGAVPDTSQGEEWHALVDRLKDPIRNTSSALLLLHHASKAGESRGSTGIRAAADFEVLLSATKDPAMRRLQYTGRTWAGFGERVRLVKYGSDERPHFTWLRVPERHDQGDSVDKYLQSDTAQGAVFRALAESARPLSYTDWRAEAGSPSKGTMGRARNGLLERGWVERRGDSRYQLTKEGRTEAERAGWIGWDGTPPAEDED